MTNETLWMIDGGGDATGGYNMNADMIIASDPYTVTAEYHIPGNTRLYWTVGGQEIACRLDVALGLALAVSVAALLAGVLAFMRKGQSHES